MKKGKSPKAPAVFELIKSMTKAEKIHFKRYLGSGGKKTTTSLQLFDLLDKMSSYNPEKIKKPLASSPVIKQLPVYYNSLYNALLNSLRNFHAKSTDAIRADEMLGEIRILLKKRLLDQTERQIKRARAFFEKREYATHLFTLGAFEYNLSVIRMKKDEFANRKAILENRASHLDYMKSQLKVTSLNNELVRIQKIRELHPEADLKQELLEVGQIFDDLKIHLDEKSNYFKFFFLGSLQHYSDIQKEPLQSFIYNRLQIETWEEMPKELHYSQNALSIILYNYFSKAEELFQYKSIDRFSPLLKGICQKEPELKLKCQVLHHIFMFHRNIIKGDWPAANLLIKEQKENLENLIDNSVPFYKMHLYQVLALHAFLNEQFDEALQWINKLQNIKNLFTIEQFVFPFKLLEVIIHFEWENYQFLENLILSISRYLEKFRRSENERVLEELWLKMMSKASNINSSKSKKAFYKKLHDEYSQLYAEERLPPSKVLIVIKSWLQARTQGISILEAWNLNALKLSEGIEAQIHAIDYEIH